MCHSLSDSLPLSEADHRKRGDFASRAGNLTYRYRRAIRSVRYAEPASSAHESADVRCDGCVQIEVNTVSTKRNRPLVKLPHGFTFPKPLQEGMGPYLRSRCLQTAWHALHTTSSGKSWPGPCQTAETLWSHSRRITMEGQRSTSNNISGARLPPDDTLQHNADIGPCKARDVDDAEYSPSIAPSSHAFDRSRSIRAHASRLRTQLTLLHAIDTPLRERRHGDDDLHLCETFHCQSVQVRLSSAKYCRGRSLPTGAQNYLGMASDAREAKVYQMVLSSFHGSCTSLEHGLARAGFVAVVLRCRKLEMTRSMMFCSLPFSSLFCGA